MEMGAVGFVVETIVSELLQNLLQISGKSFFCSGSAEELKDTVNALIPVIDEIKGSGVEVPEPRRSQIDQVSRRLQEGLEITRMILESPRYSVYRKIQLARKMDRLEKEISRFTKVLVQAHILAEVHRMRFKGSESFDRLEGLSQRMEYSLSQIAVGSGSRVAESVRKMRDSEWEKDGEGYAGAQHNVGVVGTGGVGCFKKDLIA